MTLNSQLFYLHLFPQQINHPMKFLKIVLLLIFATQIATAITLNVRDFGAKGDGKTLDTKAIQAAVDNCTLKGGKVILADGDFLSGTIYLKNNVTLVVEKGARILGSTKLADYPMNQNGFRFYAENYVNRALIYANKAVNIGIEGGGTIDGQGTNWQDKAYLIRPYLFWFIECRKVNVKDVELRSPAMWMQYYLGCDDVRIENIKIHSHGSYNNDMLDIDGCRNVIVKGVIGDSDDDGITFKSTYGRISENITVSDCIVRSHCNGIKFGTETTGGFRNVTITNCVVRSSEVDEVLYGIREGMSGIAVEIVDGGIMENINISDIVIDGPRVPIFVRLGNRARKHFPEAPEPPIGVMKNIKISNIIARAGSLNGCSILGTPGGYIENLSLSNIRIICTGGGTEKDALAIVPEHEKRYPESLSFGILSSYGMFIRHVKDLSLSGLSFDLQEKDARPLIQFDDVHNATARDITVSGKHSTEKFKVGENCTGIVIQ